MRNRHGSRFLIAMTAAGVLMSVSGVIAAYGQTPQTAPVKTAAQYYNEGVVAFNAAKYDEAAIAFTNAIKKHPGTPYADAYYGRGLSYNRKKEYTKAFEDFKKTIAVKPDLPDAYLELASAYMGMSKYSEALQAYTTAEQKGANKNDVLRFRGGLYYRMKDYDKAIADWSAYIAADPKAPASIHYNLGLAYLDKKDFTKAVEAFTNALKGQPNYGPARSARAEAYMGMDPPMYAEAFADANAALRADPNDETAKRVADEARKYL
jgi:tetratricopeptide (TPR) repeat protein